MMDIKQLEYFVTIVNEGSISAASRKLFMTQPPISNQMKILEQSLGCQLFERGSRTITLTTQGQLLYKKANDILSIVNDTHEQLMTLNNEIKHLKIGIVSSFVGYCSKLLSDYYKYNNDVLIEVTEANTYKLIELLQSSEIDLAIVRKPYPTMDFHEYELLEDKIVAVGKKLPKTVTMEYLANCPLIIYRRWQSIIMKEFEKRKLKCRMSIINDDARTSLTFAENEMGIALVPASSTKDINNLEVRMIDDLYITSAVCLVYKNNSKLNDNLIEYIKSKNLL